jgi:ASC-1-like (ASCH) protein
MIKILHLTLKKKWFDLIRSGKKTTEYREIKLYWSTRLLNQNFDEIHFRNGYNPKSPFMRVEWKKLEKEKFEGLMCYAIRLGKILEVQNV